MTGSSWKPTLLTMRGIALYLAGATALGYLSVELRRLYLVWFNSPEQSGLGSTVWAMYNLPFVTLGMVGLFVIGYVVAAFHTSQRRRVLLLCAMAQALFALPWAMETLRLLDLGLWPHPITRQIVAFQAFVAFVVNPLCLLAGGFLRPLRSLGVAKA